MPCPVGTYQHETGSTECHVGRAGFRVWSLKSAPVQCEAGTTNDLEGSTECFKCPGGTYWRIPRGLFVRTSYRENDRENDVCHYFTYALALTRLHRWVSLSLAQVHQHVQVVIYVVLVEKVRAHYVSVVPVVTTSR